MGARSGFRDYPQNEGLHSHTCLPCDHADQTGCLHHSSTWSLPKDPYQKWVNGSNQNFGVIDQPFFIRVRLGDSRHPLFLGSAASRRRASCGTASSSRQSRTGKGVEAANRWSGSDFTTLWWFHGCLLGFFLGWFSGSFRI